MYDLAEKVHTTSIANCVCIGKVVYSMPRWISLDKPFGSREHAVEGVKKVTWTEIGLSTVYVRRLSIKRLVVSRRVVKYFEGQGPSPCLIIMIGRKCGFAVTVEEKEESSCMFGTGINNMLNRVGLDACRGARCVIKRMSRRRSSSVSAA